MRNIEEKRIFAFDELPERELSAENLMTGIIGSFINHRIVLIDSVSEGFKQAYIAANPYIIDIAERSLLVPKKEVSPRFNSEEDYGFQRGIQSAIDRDLAFTLGTSLRLQPKGMLQVLNFWGSLPGSKDMYDSIAQQILYHYSKFILKTQQR